MVGIYSNFGEYEENYKMGVEHGSWVFHYENGEKRSSEVYVDGIRTGPFSSWFENGQMESKGS